MFVVDFRGRAAFADGLGGLAGGGEAGLSRFRHW